MKNALLASTTLAAVCALSAASPARAADTGIELQLRGGFGTAGKGSPITVKDGVQFSGNGTPGTIYGGTAKPYGWGFHGEASAGYRIIKIFSIGLAAGIRNSGGKDVDDQQSVSRSAFYVGPYARFYIPLIPLFDPWISVGVQYVKDKQTYNRPVAGFATDWTLTHNGVGFPITIGLDYKPIPLVAIGPNLRYERVVNAGGCAKVAAGGASSSFCTDDTPSATQGKAYDVWSIALHARVTF